MGSLWIRRSPASEQGYETDLSRYCPFPKEYREKLKTNPLYTSLFERYENNKKKELTRMNSVAFRAQRNNHGQTPEPLLAQIEYLEK